MGVLADVIYPAFLHPYILQVFMPLTGVAALAAEIIVYGLWYGRSSLLRVALAAVAANVVSSLVGVGLAELLPSGLNPEFVAHSTGEAQGPNWSVLAALAWPVACVASIAIEYPAIFLLTRAQQLRHLLMAVCVANVTSYLVLYVAVRIGFWRMWLK